MKKTHRIITISPFTYLTPSIKNISFIILAVLLPQVLMLFFTKSYKSLILIAIAIFTSMLTEVLFNVFRKQKSLFDLQALVQGLLIGMLMPSSYPILPFVCILMSSLFLVKYFFGGFSYSWINPIAFTLVIAYLFGFNFFNIDLLVLDYITVKEPVSQLLADGHLRVLAIDTKIITFLNTNFFSYIGAEISPGYISYMWDSLSIIPALRFGILTLLASIVLFSLDVIRYYTPISFILSYGFCVALFPQNLKYSIFGQGDIIFAFFSSGVLFSVFFILDWPGTSPLNPLGKILYGLLSGIIAFILVGSGQSTIGLMFTILLINILSPLLQLFEESLYKRKLKSLILNKE